MPTRIASVADLCGFGDDYFYNQEKPPKGNRMDYALYCYQLAAGLDEKNDQALWEAISVCWQGSPTRLKAALPYAVVLADLNPNPNEVAAILRKISES